MALISGPIAIVDSTVETLSAKVFSKIGSQMVDVLEAVGIIGLALIVLNHLFQFRMLPVGAIMIYGVRFVLIYAFARTWENFQPIYELITDFPSDLAGSILDEAGRSSGIGSIYSKLDKIVIALIGSGVGFTIATTIFTLAFMTPGLVLIAAGLSIASAVLGVVLGAKITIGVCMIIAPLMLAAALLPATNSLFQGWLRLTLGAAITPVIFSALMAVVLAALDKSFTGGFKGIISGLVIVFSCFALVNQIPTIVYAITTASSMIAGAIPGSSIGDAVSQDIKRYRSSNALFNTKPQRRRVDDNPQDAQRDLDFDFDLDR